MFLSVGLLGGGGGSSTVWKISHTFSFIVYFVYFATSTSMDARD